MLKCLSLHDDSTSSSFRNALDEMFGVRRDIRVWNKWT